MQDKPEKKMTKKTEKPSTTSKAKTLKAGTKVEAETKKAAKLANTGPKPRQAPLIHKTFVAKPNEILSEWQILDAANQPLGRLSSFIAHVLMGKHKAGYTRSADTGDFVVVLNAEKVKLTGNKWADKTYYHHTGYVGGIKAKTAQQIRDTKPEQLIEKAVWRMLPHGHMGRKWFKKLKVYAGSEHPHQAQKPNLLAFPYARAKGENHA